MLLLVTLTSACADKEPTAAAAGPPVVVETFDGSAAVVHFGAADPVAMTLPIGDGAAKQYLVDRDASGLPVRLRGLRRFSIDDPTRVDEARFTAEGRPDEVLLATGAQVRFRYVADQVLVVLTQPDGQTITTTFAVTSPARASAARSTAARDAAARTPSVVLRPAAAVAAAEPVTGSILVTGPDGVVSDAVLEVEVRRPPLELFQPAAQVTTAGGGRYTFSFPTNPTPFKDTDIGRYCSATAALADEPCKFLKQPGVSGYSFLFAFKLFCDSIRAFPLPYGACMSTWVLLTATCFVDAACTGGGKAYDWALAQGFAQSTWSIRGFVHRGTCVRLIPSWTVTGVVPGATLAPVEATTDCKPDVAVDVGIAGPPTAVVAGSAGTLTLSALASTSGSANVPVGSLTISGPGLSGCTSSDVGTKATVLLTCEAGIPTSAGSFTYTAVAEAAGATSSASTPVTVTAAPFVDSTAIYRAAIPGTWSWSWYRVEDGGFHEEDQIALYPDGTGRRLSSRYYDGHSSGYDQTAPPDIKWGVRPGPSGRHALWLTVSRSGDIEYVSLLTYPLGPLNGGGYSFTWVLTRGG